MLWAAIEAARARGLQKEERGGISEGNIDNSNEHSFCYSGKL